MRLCTTAPANWKTSLNCRKSLEEEHKAVVRKLFLKSQLKFFYKPKQRKKNYNFTLIKLLKNFQGF